MKGPSSSVDNPRSWHYSVETCEKAVQVKEMMRIAGVLHHRHDDVRRMMTEEVVEEEDKIVSALDPLDLVGDIETQLKRVHVEGAELERDVGKGLWILLLKLDEERGTRETVQRQA